MHHVYFFPFFFFFFPPPPAAGADAGAWGGAPVAGVAVPDAWPDLRTVMGSSRSAAGVAALLPLKAGTRRLTLPTLERRRRLRDSKRFRMIAEKDLYCKHWGVR